MKITLGLLLALILIAGCNNPFEKKEEIPPGVFAQISTTNGKAYCQNDVNDSVSCFYSDFPKVRITTDYNMETTSKSIACGICVQELDERLFE